MQSIKVRIELGNNGDFVVLAPDAFLRDGRPVIRGAAFPAQSAAEHYAAGVAAGLRACGRSCEVVIDVPDDADDLLDMGALDAWAQRSGGDAVDTAEADPVARRLAREAEAGRFIAEHHGI